MLKPTDLQEMLAEPGPTTRVEGNLHVSTAYDNNRDTKYFAILVCDNPLDIRSPRWERHSYSVKTAWQSVRDARKSSLYKNDEGN